MANIRGTAGNDFLVGDFDPLLPDDVLNSSWLAGADTMSGGNGDDTYNVNSNDDVVGEGNGPSSGIDTVISQVLSYTLTDNVENLVLQEVDHFGTVNANGTVSIALGFGAPTAITGTGNLLDNHITGNSNNNQLYGLDGDDTLAGLDGNDVLRGGDDNDSLDGGDGNDLLYGENNNDTLSGGEGEGLDTLDGGSGSDSMTGGAGNDVYFVDAAGDVVVEASALVSLLPPGTDAVYASISETLDANVENLFLTGTASLNGTGNASANWIVGNTAANTLDGLGGADTLQGGGGNDTYVVNHASDQIVEIAGAGTDLVKASVTFKLNDVDVENLTLTGSTAINGTGNSSANLIKGNSASNTLKGLVGNDTLQGNGGDDIIEGGDDADRIYGGLGIDILHGHGAANDNEEDRFYFSTALNATTNWDKIESASFDGVDGVEDDEIYLDDAIFTGLSMAGGALVEYAEGAGTTGNLVTDGVGIYLDTSTGNLYYNATATVANDSVLFASISNFIAGGSASLEASDFTLY
jgi:Ca2+-binding RTX toxin-like protein